MQIYFLEGKTIKYKIQLYKILLLLFTIPPVISDSRFNPLLSFIKTKTSKLLIPLILEILRLLFLQFSVQALPHIIFPNALHDGSYPKSIRKLPQNHTRSTVLQVHSQNRYCRPGFDRSGKHDRTGGSESFLNISSEITTKYSRVSHRRRYIFIVRQTLAYTHQVN